MEIPTCFKAYDIRGSVPDEFNADMAYRIVLGYADLLKPRRVVVGGDPRLSTMQIQRAVAEALKARGCDVLDIGVSLAEEVYFATVHWQLDGGIVVTASHNPENYNGLKLVKKRAEPVNSQELSCIAQKFMAHDSAGNAPLHPRAATFERTSVRCEYVSHLLSLVDVRRFCPLRIVLNAGHGAAGPAIRMIASQLQELGSKVKLLPMNVQPNGHFPYGVPNPILPEQHPYTAEAVVSQHADLGVAFDGDGDRCFFFDHKGNFINSYYIVGLLAEYHLKRQLGGTIIYDPRLRWNTEALVAGWGGCATLSRSGHIFMKEKMRKLQAIYGGEVSGHHYFKDFFYCDSGMLPWLILLAVLSTVKQSLADLVADAVLTYPSSGELNCQAAEPEKVLIAVREHFSLQALSMDYTDGLSMTFDGWRFNLRAAATEPLIRLNVESDKNEAFLSQKRDEVVALIQATIHS